MNCKCIDKGDERPTIPAPEPKQIIKAVKEVSDQIKFITLVSIMLVLALIIVFLVRRVERVEERLHKIEFRNGSRS